MSTRQWAQSHEYDAQKLFQKLFQDDIKYLLSMENLWQKRRPPTPLDWNDLPDAIAGSSAVPDNSVLKDQRVWSMKECAEVLKQSVNLLKMKLAEEKNDDGVTAALIWDKDDDPAMDFVTACANIRSHIFGIQQKSRFDTKCNVLIFARYLLIIEFIHNYDVFDLQQWQEISFLLSHPQMLLSLD